MLKHVKTGWNYVATNWHAAAGYMIATLLLMALLGWRLGTLVPAFSEPEIRARQSSSSLQAIVDNPVNAPHKIGQFIMQKLGQDGAIGMRSVSAGFAVIAVWLFYALLLRWNTQRIAIIGTALFATSSWFLHSARLATPNILLTALLAVASCGFFIRYGRIRAQAWLFTALILGMSLYVPMMGWFIVLGIIWQARLLRDSFKLLQAPVILACIAIIAACAAPLVYALIRTPELWHELTGIPQTFAPIKEIALNIGRVPMMLFVRAPADPVYWLARLPLLDLFASVMFIFGTYAYAFKLRLHRVQLLLVVFVVTSVMIGLSASFENITMMLPFVYLVVTAGVTLMLQQWFTVFPRNPIARNIGLGFMIAAVVFACSYHVINYFIAWPNTPETRQAYSIKA